MSAVWGGEPSQRFLGNVGQPLQRSTVGLSGHCRGGTKLADFPSESDLNVDLALTNVKKPALELP